MFCSLTLVQLLNAKQDGVQEYVQLGAACELFLRYVTRTSNDEHGKTLDQMEFKRSLIRRGDGFKDQSIRSRDAIAKCGSAFVRDGAVLLLHGYSSVVMRLLEKVALPTAALKQSSSDAVGRSKILTSDLKSYAQRLSPATKRALSSAVCNRGMSPSPSFQTVR
jgi:hypothetical protein